MTIIKQLVQEYAVKDVLEFFEDKNGLVFIKLQTQKFGASISLLGGQVLSFKPAGESEDLLYLSPKAYYQTGKAIKGGCPICWPCFAQSKEYDSLPFHGFVRNQNWHVKHIEFLNDDVLVTLLITDNEMSRKVWPYGFELEQTIRLGASLSVELTTKNTGNESFLITQAVHTYFKVGDISAVTVGGLEDKEYLDKVTAFSRESQQGLVSFSQEVDRIYLETGRQQIITDTDLNRIITVDGEHSHTTVVWNPWQEISRNSADLDDESYRHFVCVETANTVDEVIKVNPGESISLKATYQVEALG